MSPMFPIRALVTALIMALSASPALAQTAMPTPEQREQLDAARAQFERASKKLQELSREYGVPPGPAWISSTQKRMPVIGVLLAPDAEAGVKIVGVTPDSAAADAGLKSGDRLLSVAGHPLAGGDGATRLENARHLLAAPDDDAPIALGYERAGRKLSVALKPRLGRQLMFISGDGDDTGAQVVHLDQLTRELDSLQDEAGGGIPRIERNVRILSPDDCNGEQCHFPVLAEALRWKSFNLASLDPQLGRYFGADRGVLVVSAGPDLPGLQGGDVIRKIDGKSVATPREAMDSLRGRKAGSRVTVEYLRDRKPATTQISVPKSPLPPIPPPPPPPPGPPMPPRAGADAHPPRVVEQRKIVIVDKDGQVQTWEDDGNDPHQPPEPPLLPPPPPVPPIK